MKVNLTLLAFLIVFLSGCCPDSDDVPVATETKGWIPYQDGQWVHYRNDNQEAFSLRTALKNDSYDQASGKRFCQYEVERRILKLTDPATGAETVQISLQSKDIYIGKEVASPNTEAVFNLENNYQTIHGTNAARYEFISQDTLNGTTYQNIIHYSQGGSPDPLNVYQEYYFVKDHGLIAIKLKDNPAFFYVHY
jgi:hypothetical protein